jgi:hypothetical protein
MTTSDEVRIAEANDTPRARRQPTYEEIAAAAYERYLSRGGSHGRDLEDWLEAERDLGAERTG